jgi:transposase
MTGRVFKSGQDRQQASFLPPRIEDYVGADNPVRAIEAYVSTLDLRQLGFRLADGNASAGQPAYDPADLLKLYLYGYLNQVRSTRRLEREAGRNLELIWLLRGLVPGYRTIGNFRKDNRKALQQVNRDFVLVARELDLLGGELVAIDGAFFHGDASKGSIVTAKSLAEQLAALERDIAAYGEALEASDAAEAVPIPGGDISEKLKRLQEKQTAAQAGLAQLAASGETQLSRTDADARLLSKNGQTVAGYNVQIAVDDKHKLIVASEVVNDGNDTGQLYAMAQAAKDALGAQTLQALADTGYYNGETLKACEAEGITPYVPPTNRGQRADGRFGPDDFVYDDEADVYRCPAGAALRPMNGRKIDASGKAHIVYASLRSACKGCPLRAQCLSEKAPRKTIYRWEHHDVIDRHRARMAKVSGVMQKRKELAEHPFGTIKCRAGYRHFLMRGFDKVRGEWSLMALCYNFTRVLNIIGIARFIAYLAKSGLILVLWLFAITMAAIKRSTSNHPQISAESRSNLSNVRNCYPLRQNIKFLPSLVAKPINNRNS